MFLLVCGNAISQTSSFFTTNPNIIGKLTFQNGWVLQDTVSGFKFSGNLWLGGSTIFFGSTYFKDSAGYVVSPSTPIFSTTKPWIKNEYLQDTSIHGSKIKSSTLTSTIFAPSTKDSIFGATNLGNISTVINDIKTRYNLLFNSKGDFKSSVFITGLMYDTLNKKVKIDTTVFFKNIDTVKFLKAADSSRFLGGGTDTNLLLHKYDTASFLAATDSNIFLKQRDSAFYATEGVDVSGLLPRSDTSKYWSFTRQYLDSFWTKAKFDTSDYYVRSALDTANLWKKSQLNMNNYWSINTYPPGNYWTFAKQDTNRFWRTNVQLLNNYWTFTNQDTSRFWRTNVQIPENYWTFTNQDTARFWRTNVQNPANYWTVSTLDTSTLWKKSAFDPDDYWAKTELSDVNIPRTDVENTWADTASFTKAIKVDRVIANSSNGMYISPKRSQDTVKFGEGYLKVKNMPVVVESSNGTKNVTLTTNTNGDLNITHTPTTGKTTINSNLTTNSLTTNYFSTNTNIRDIVGNIAGGNRIDSLKIGNGTSTFGDYAITLSEDNTNTTAGTFFIINLPYADSCIGRSFKILCKYINTDYIGSDFYKIETRGSDAIVGLDATEPTNLVTFKHYNNIELFSGGNGMWYVK